MLLGMTGSGKSYLFKQWLGALQSEGRACFVLDIGDEYSQQGNSRGGTLQLGPLRQRLTVPQFLERAARDPRLVLSRSASIAIVPTVQDAGEALAEHIRPVLRFIYGRGNCVLGFDELQKYGGQLAPELYRAAGELGKDGVTPFFLSQYPGGVPEIVRKQVSTCIAAEMGKDSDRRMLANDFGDPFAAALRDAPERVFHIGFSRSRFATIPRGKTHGR
ncbi:hypothetical protein OWM54_41895 [Myxococcus sp. MISCRS1]|uniref:hypothetical protein n=1 Tax=Myxococcus sp. MISCRS1 TaxID=2996786 RepID=UPI00226F2A9D|nr:hypothetical protein [Myxococcus sp. MISCRS1]MCY1003717.1 hypothetical protein [Myxococcus sp. MISCRS1]